MADKGHFNAFLKIEQVEFVDVPVAPGSRGLEKKNERRVSEVLTLSVKADSLEELRNKIKKHMEVD